MSQEITYYYVPNTDGSIAAHSASVDMLYMLGYTDDQILQTDLPCITGYDGKLYLLGSEPQPPIPTSEELQADFAKQISLMLDGFATTPVMATQATFTGTNEARLAEFSTDYSALGAAMRTLYEAVRAKEEELLPLVTTGQLSVDDAMAQMPTLSWDVPVNTPAYATATALQAHKDADMLRWQEFYDLKAQFLDLQAGVQNKVLDPTQVVDIEAVSTSGGYTVTSLLGGRVTFTDTIVLLDLIPGSVAVNGVVVWSGQALGLGTVEDHVDVNDGDIITTSGMNTVTFTAYISSTAAASVTPRTS